jgi:hypothetical protein
MTDEWATGELRDQVGRAVDDVLAGEVRDGAMALWRLGMTSGDLGLASGLWQIWGRITDEYTHPRGDSEAGESLAREAANELRAALGDPARERNFCDRWIYERLDIVL